VYASLEWHFHKELTPIAWSLSRSAHNDTDGRSLVVAPGVRMVTLTQTLAETLQKKRVIV
jgi:hypothetical protein